VRTAGRDAVDVHDHHDTRTDQPQQVRKQVMLARQEETDSLVRLQQPNVATIVDNDPEKSRTRKMMRVIQTRETSGRSST
jgi:hypothetical protein